MFFGNAKQGRFWFQRTNKRPAKLASNLTATIAIVLGAIGANAAPFQNFPGAVPLQYERQAASDLIYQGKVLLPDEARKLFESGTVKDLSELDPIANSDIWRNEPYTGSLTKPDEMGLQADGEQLEFISNTEVPIGSFGFLVAKTLPNGAKKTFQIYFDVKSHNVLLRKNLLRKLGYRIPPTQHLSKFQIKFDGAFDKRDFVRDLQNATFLESNRWVVGGAEDESSILDLQDAIVFEGANDLIYNLARGNMASSVIQGRRLFNALLVPYALLDVTESLNVFPWVAARVFNKQLVFQYDDAEEFSTSYEDARWITRRILNLSRLDWEEVIAAAELPPEVSRLLVEKLLARRNSLIEQLGFKKSHAELAINSKISSGPRLQNGKLIGETWPGYASRFAAKDPDSPLAGDEIWGLFKSKFLSNLISNVVTEFNDRFVPRTDVGWEIFDHNLDMAARQLADFILTGEVKEIPFGFWSAPTYNGNIIAAREIVAGNYLGAENIVQLADTVGFAVDAGVYIGADGLPTKMTFQGGAKASFVRTYTHLKPIRSIKAGLKEPFKNMMVPWLKRKQSQPLEKLIALEGKREALGEEEFAKQLEAQLKEFKSALGVGESLIIQTSIGADISAQPGYGINDNIQVYLALKDKLTRISRLHIFRKDEKTFQIYRDPAIYNLFDLAIGLEARIQVLQLGWSWLKGSANTEFLNLVWTLI